MLLARIRLNPAFIFSGILCVLASFSGLSPAESEPPPAGALESLLVELEALQSTPEGRAALDQLVQSPGQLSSSVSSITASIEGHPIPLVTRSVDFGSEIYPLLETHCFSCHGPDKQRSKLRLDARQVVLKGGASGQIVHPGDGNASPLFQRIAGHGGEQQMPPTGPKLSGEEMGLIRAWIDQGALWPEDVGSAAASVEEHWAYVVPQAAAAPIVKQTTWPRNDVDAFVLAKLEEKGLAPSPQAERTTLIRRLALDLTGIPPTPAEVQSFLADESPKAWDTLVERFLASPRYGEKWARVWLDLARYADTNGYEKDLVRNHWPWRDWVIEAFNQNMPYDQFTIEQIAGDLLPNASRSQRISTGFHRNTMLNDEGGIDAEEFRIVAVKDRVETTAAIWLGATIGCAQCHDHKYDPFTQKEYYEFLSFFNTTQDVGRGEEPILKLPTDDQQREIDRLSAEIATLESVLNTPTAELEDAQKEWETRLLNEREEWNVPVASKWSTEPTSGSILTMLEDRSFLAVGPNPDNEVYRLELPLDQSTLTGLRLEALTHETLPHGGPGRFSNAGFVLGRVSAELKFPDGSESPVKFTQAEADHTQKNFDVASLIAPTTGPGWATDSSMDGHRVDRAVLFLVEPTTTTVQGATLSLTLSHYYGRGHNLGRFRVAVTDVQNPADARLMPADLRSILTAAPETRNATDTAKLAAYFRSTTPLLDEPRQKLADANSALEGIKYPTTMVLQEMEEPRKTFLLERGNFLTPGYEVQASVPAVLHDFPESEPKNRLTLAKWLVSRENPMAARVIVNRIWAAYFGQGLVKTAEDFGSQGDLPTHPLLLDWLAVKFMDSGWDLKALHRMIVSSATYRQSSWASPELLEMDPYNQLLARGPRYRMEAEMLRDNALAVSGLLSPKIGGPSVFPPQPPGIWEASFATHDTNAKWVEDTDENRYRRGIYTFIRRTAPYPTLLMFDGTNREVCTVMRSRTNTPLQALATLNDPVFVEASAAFARRILSEGGPDWEARIGFAFQASVSRPPTEQEKEIARKLYNKASERFVAGPEQSVALLSHSRVESGALEPAELAAWTVVANVLLNLDETLTKG